MEFKKESVDIKYEIGDDIGRGQFANVKRCRERQTGNEYAAKFIRKRRGGGRRGAKLEDIQREIEILTEANHRNIINLYEVFETNREVILILELVDGGELFEHLSERDKLCEEEASSFIKQILDGLEHLHSKNIAHLDLKPENILLQDRGSTAVKLIDFGLSRKIGPKQDVRAMNGTAEFVAPEVVSYEPLSVSTDMWSIGVLTYILLSGASPFLGENQQDTYHNITSLNYQFDEEYFDGTSELAKDFIQSLLVKDQRKRATIYECLKHPWIKPVEKRHKALRRSSVINTEQLKKFLARQRWKRSMKIVSLCNRLSRSMQLRRIQSSDTLGSTSEEETTKADTAVEETLDSSVEISESIETDVNSGDIVQDVQTDVSTVSAAAACNEVDAVETFVSDLINVAKDLLSTKTLENTEMQASLDDQDKSGKVVLEEDDTIDTETATCNDEKIRLEDCGTEIEKESWKLIVMSDEQTAPSLPLFDDIGINEVTSSDGYVKDISTSEVVPPGVKDACIGNIRDLPEQTNQHTSKISSNLSKLEVIAETDYAEEIETTLLNENETEELVPPVVNKEDEGFIPVQITDEFTFKEVSAESHPVQIADININYMNVGEFDNIIEDLVDINTDHNNEVKYDNAAMEMKGDNPIAHDEESNIQRFAQVLVENVFKKAMDQMTEESMQDIRKIETSNLNDRTAETVQNASEFDEFTEVAKQSSDMDYDQSDKLVLRYTTDITGSEVSNSSELNVNNQHRVKALDKEKHSMEKDQKERKVIDSLELYYASGLVETARINVEEVIKNAIHQIEAEHEKATTESKVSETCVETMTGISIYETETPGFIGTDVVKVSTHDSNKEECLTNRHLMVAAHCSESNFIDTSRNVEMIDKEQQMCVTSNNELLQVNTELIEENIPTNDGSQYEDELKLAANRIEALNEEIQGQISQSGRHDSSYVKMYDPLKVTMFEVDDINFETFEDRLSDEEGFGGFDSTVPCDGKKNIKQTTRKKRQRRLMKTERSMKKANNFWEMEDYCSVSRCEMFEMQVLNNSE